ncbi:MAG: hypothetical protein GY863_00515, partial [bacterium]|nr:hypothetical protein [bacterium]
MEKNRSFRIVLVLIILTVMLSHAVYAQSVRDKVNQANELYQTEKYEEAMNLYRDAALDD